MSRLLVSVPLVALAASFFIAPYITSLRDVTDAPPPLVIRPHLLYRHEHISFFYTSADLLHPEAFGRPGEFIEAVLFDIWPGGEGTSRPIESLTWFTRTWSVIAGGPTPSSQADVDLAERFRSSIGGLPRMKRGQIALFALPAQSTYGRQSGLRELVALAIHPPPDPGSAAGGTPLLFSEALERAFRGLGDAHVRSAGIPRMIARDTIGQAGSRAESWKMILPAADAKARATGIRTVLFGGWSIDPRARAATDEAFRIAWEQRRQELATDMKVIAHEQWRSGALIAFAALLRWHLKRRTVRWLRVLALIIVAAGLALMIAQATQWLWAHVPGPAVAVFLLECATALAAGAAIEQVVQFDPKKAVRDESAEEPP